MKYKNSVTNMICGDINKPNMCNENEKKNFKNYLRKYRIQKWDKNILIGPYI